MKLKHLFEYNLKSQDLPNTKQYEYIETENYIFLKLDKEQSYAMADFNYVLSTEEVNNYLNNMVIPSKINKDTLIDFFDNNYEFFNRINLYNHNEIFNFNNLKHIFSKNYMGYSDWDLCTSDIDLQYELSTITFNNVQNVEHCTIYQYNQLMVSPPTRMTSSDLKIIGNKYTSHNQYTSSYSNYNLNIQFITRRK